MGSVVIEQLERFGPDRCEPMGLEASRAWVAELAGTHYENFSVVSWLLPRRLREPFAAVYSFCRWADDLGDEVGDRAESLRLLGWWREELGRCYAGEPRHPVFVALEPVVREYDVPIEPFDDLIRAFEQDQEVDRYETWEQVVDYCTRSADPVGRLVLYLCGYRDAGRQALSDKTCTALQLVNFWQDVRRDVLERDRVYVPSDALEAGGLSHGMVVGHVRGEAMLDDEAMRRWRGVLGGLLDRTDGLFAEGEALWPEVSGDVRLPIRLFSMGGQSVSRAIRRMEFDTLNRRPVVGKGKKLGLAMRAMVGKVMGG